MATTDAEHLASINAVITARTTGQATEAFWQANKHWRGTSLSELFRIRDELELKIAQASGPNFYLGRRVEL
jgi:hypothetical protein